MKSFSWIIYYCVMAMFCNIYSMEKRRSLLETHSLTYIVGEVEKEVEDEISQEQQEETKKKSKKEMKKEWKKKEQKELEKKECKEKREEQQKEREKIGWEILLRYGIAFFDYTMIRSLAVNYHFNKLLCDSADKRKSYLQRYASRSDFDHYIECNRSCVYGAVNGKLLIESLNNLEHILTIERNHLLNPINLPHSYKRYNFHGLLPHQPPPFFNHNGDFCFYGYGEKSNVLHEKSGKVVLYSLSTEGRQDVMGCVAHTRKKTFNLREFLEFPSLLKAFLNSCEVYDAKSDGTLVKVFDIKGVIIPADYRCHKQYFSVIRYPSFSAFPEELENEIDALYIKQSVRKKKKFWGVI